MASELPPLSQALDVRFIEYMPFDGNRWNLSKFVPYSDMLSKVMARWPQLTRLTDQPNDTSKVVRTTLANSARFLC